MRHRFNREQIKYRRILIVACLIVLALVIIVTRSFAEDEVLDTVFSMAVP